MSRLFQITDQDFDEQVIHSSLPVVVDFWAEWCEPCKDMAPMIGELAQKYQSKIKFAKMNVVNNRDTSAKLGIRSLPTFIFFKRGEAVHTMIGSFPRSVFEEEVRRIL